MKKRRSPSSTFTRKRWVFWRGGMLLALTFAGFMNLMAEPVQPERAYFKDLGRIPNSALPLLLYRRAFAADTPDLPAAVEERFASNEWTGSWRASVFPFHHFHTG